MKPAQKTPSLFSCCQGERGEALEVGRAPGSASHRTAHRVRANFRRQRLLQLLGWICMNVVGGTLAEKTCAHFRRFGWKRKHGGLRERGRYKSGDAPYYVQKVAQAI